jgi:MFS family permease
MVSAGVKARWAVTSVFAINGSIIASQVVRTPSIKIEYGLSAAQLGLTATAFGVAAVLAMQGAGRLAARVGSGPVVRVTMALLPLALLGIGLAGDAALLFPAMALAGAVHGLMDVTMNAHAVAIERALGRPILNGCHAAWSVGAVAGSLVGGAAAGAGASLALNFAVLAALLVPAALCAGLFLLPAAADRVDHGASTNDVRGVALVRRLWTVVSAGWSRRLLVLGAMGATVMTVEAAVANWSGVLLHERLGATLGIASLGYILFSGCETTVRLVGDRLLVKHRPAVMVGWGIVVAVVGLGVVVASSWPVVTIAGFAVMGIGLATVLPVMFGVVGHQGADADGAAAAVSRFSTMTYAGVFLGPALTGWLAELLGLRGMLALLLAPLAIVAWRAASVVGARPPHTDAALASTRVAVEA